MASIKSFLLLPILILSLSATSTAAVPTSSLDSLLALLRNSGHSLFANAISTSDLLFDLLRLSSFTLLIPPNPSLFALDLALPSNSYLSSLRLHIIPNHSLPLTNTVISTSAAANHTSTAHPLKLRTLNPSRVLHLTTSPTTGTILIDGVELLLPPLFLSKNVTVYRIRGAIPAQVTSPPHRPHRPRHVPGNRKRPAPIHPRNAADPTPIQLNQTDLAPAPLPVFFSDLAPDSASPIPNNTASVKEVETGSPSPLVENRQLSAPLAPVTSGFTISPSDKEETCGPLEWMSMQCGGNRVPTPIQPNLSPAPHSEYVPVLAPSPLNVSVLAPSPANNPTAFPAPNNTANSTESTDRTDVLTGLPATAPLPITSGFMISNFEMSDYDGEGEISGLSALEKEERCGKTVNCNDLDDGDGNGYGHVSSNADDDYPHQHHLKDYGHL